MSIEYAPDSEIITSRCYARQLLVAGTYRRTISGHLVRAWKPPRSVHRRMQAFIYQRDGFTCQLCRKHRSQLRCLLTLDHIHPYKLGGLYIEWNLRTACESCNASKCDRVEVVNG